MPTDTTRPSLNTLRQTLSASASGAFFIHQQPAADGSTEFLLFHKSIQHAIVRTVIKRTDDGRYRLDIPADDRRLTTGGWRQVAQREYRSINQLAKALHRHCHMSELAPHTPAPATPTDNVLQAKTQALLASSPDERVERFMQWQDAYRAHREHQDRQGITDANRVGDAKWFQLDAIAQASAHEQPLLLQCWSARPALYTRLVAGGKNAFFLHIQPSATPGRLYIELYHRSDSRHIVHTTIVQGVDGRYFLWVPQNDARQRQAGWRRIVSANYATLADLATALKQQLNMTDLDPLPALPASASDPPISSYDRPVDYSWQIVAQLQDDRVVEHAAWALHNKHVAISQRLRWDEAAQTWRDAHAGVGVQRLDADSRLIVVGHGERGRDGVTRMGKLSAQQLAARLAKLLPAQGIKTLVLAGCDLADDIPRDAQQGVLSDGFAAELLRALPAKSVRALHLRDGRVSVDASGRKLSGVMLPQGGVDWRNDKLRITLGVDGQYHYRRLSAPASTHFPPAQVDQLSPPNPLIEGAATQSASSRAIVAKIPAIQGVINHVRDWYNARDINLMSWHEHTLWGNCQLLSQQFALYAILPPQQQNALRGYLQLQVIDEQVRAILDSPAATSPLLLSQAHRDQLQAFRQDLASGIAALESAIPKQLHFLWFGPLEPIQQEYMALWAEMNPDYRLTLWHDPDSLLLHELKQRIVKQAHAEHNQPHRVLDQDALEGRVIFLQNQAQAFIERYLTQQPGSTYDDAAAAFMQRHLGGDPAEIARRRANYRASYRSLDGRVALREVGELELAPQVRAVYLQERNLRGHSAAMSHIMRFAILQRHGGLYLDADLLPRLNATRFDQAMRASQPAQPGAVDLFAPLRQDRHLGDVQTRIVLDELVKQGRMPEHARANAGGRYAYDPVYTFEQRHGEAGRALVERLRQAVAGHAPATLFQPLGEVRVPKHGFRAHSGGHTRWRELFPHPDALPWLASAIAAMPQSPLMDAVPQYFAELYQTLIDDPVSLYVYRRDGFASMARGRTIEFTLTEGPTPGLVSTVHVPANSVATGALTGPNAFKNAVAAYLHQHRVLSIVADDQTLSQLLAPLANMATPEERKSSWITGVTDRPADLYAQETRYRRLLVIQTGDGPQATDAARSRFEQQQASARWIRWDAAGRQWRDAISGEVYSAAELAGPTDDPPARATRYARQLVVQIGTDAHASMAARYLHNKHAASSRWIYWDAANGHWREVIGDAVYAAAELPPNSRISVVAHGEETREGLRFGGLAARALAERLSPVLPGAHKLTTLRLVGCGGADASQMQSFVGALWQGFDAAGRQIDTVTLGADELVQVDPFGRKWNGRRIAAAFVPHGHIRWTRGTTKLTYQRSGDGSVSTAPMATLPHNPGSKPPPRSSGPLGTPLRPMTQHLLGASGTGMRLFGAYRTWQSVDHAMTQGDHGYAGFAASGYAVNLGSEVGERALMRLGAGLLKSATAAGRLIARAAPLINLLTTPWDLYDAAHSFSQAKALDDKARQDALVNGGFALAGFFATVAVTGFALAGGSAAALAGPIGLAAGIGLIVGSQTYAAVRQVEEIERWLPLSIWDKVRLGTGAFFGLEVDPHTRLQLMAAQAAPNLDQQALSHAEEWLRTQGCAMMLTPKVTVSAREYASDRAGAERVDLAWQGSHNHQHIHLGQYDDRQAQQGKQALCKARISQYDAGPLQAKTCPLGDITTRHYELFIADSDDKFDFSQGIDTLSADQKAQLNIARSGTHPDGPVQLDFGNGNDVITGVKSLPNHFRLGRGDQTAHGGERDDVFHLDALPSFGAQSLYAQASRQALAGKLAESRHQIDGGAGQDTLVIATDLTGSGFDGYQVDLHTGQISLVVAGKNNLFARAGHARNIEHIQQHTTVRHASRHRFYGNALSNRLAGDSHDHLEGRSGHDSYLVSLSQADDHVTIVDDNRTADGQDEWSTVLLDVPQTQLKSWTIEGDTLLLSAESGATLTLQDIYFQGQLQNGRFQFVTRDGFQLTPRLASERKAETALVIDAVYLPGLDRTRTDASQGVTIDLTAGSIARAGLAPQTLGAPYRLVAGGGTRHNDTIVGSSRNEHFFASAGDDRFEGNGGEDMYFIDDSTGLSEIGTGEDSNTSALVLTHARLNQITLRRDGTDLLIDTPHGKTVRHLDSTHRAPLVLIDKYRAELRWQIDPVAAGIESIVQKAAAQGAQLHSHAAHINLLIGADGNDQFEARHSGTLMKGGNGADSYALAVAGHFLIDNQAGDELEDHLIWQGFDGGKSALQATRLGNHLVLGNAAGTASVTLAAYYASGHTRHLKLSLSAHGNDAEATLTAAELWALADTAPLEDTGTIERQLQQLIDASSRFTANEGTAPAIAAPLDPARVTPQLAVPM